MPRAKLERCEIMPNIKEIETYLITPKSAKNLLFCRVIADDGTYGWGEAYVTRGRGQIVRELISILTKTVVGRSVFEIRHLTRVIYDDFLTRRISMDAFAAWSAIEIALWDIVGKLCKQPVYNLLGGPVRDHIRVYANGWCYGTTNPEETVEKCKAMVDMGFTAVKWTPFSGPWRNFIDRKEEDRAVENVRAMREAFPTLDLLVEAHRRLSPHNAIRFAERIREFDPFVLEEPCSSDNKELLQQVKQAVPYIKIVTGETCYTKSEFKDIFTLRCADVINPEICACNGILGMVELASMCEPYSIEFSPHNFNSTVVSLAAMVHVAAVAPTFNIAEHIVSMAKRCEPFVTKGLKLDHGYIDLPTEPGLGIDLDADALRRMEALEFYEKALTPISDEYPSKAKGHGGR